MRLGSWRLASVGLRSAWREPRLAVLLWAVQLLLTLIAIGPVHFYLSRTLAPMPEGDRLLSDFDLPLLFDLYRDAGGSTAALGPLLLAILGVGLLWNPLAAGGALEVLRTAGLRRFALRFGRGAGRYFGRFLRMGVTALVCGLLVAALSSGPFSITFVALYPAAEVLCFFLALAGIAVAICSFTLALLALDLARVQVACEGARSGVRIYLRTLLRVLRRPLDPFGLWLALTLSLVLAVAICLGLRSLLPSGGGALLLAALLLQQGAVFARAFYRVALWSGEIALIEGQARLSADPMQ